MLRRILVIGATGLLGEPVARSLQAAGLDVRVMSRDAARARQRFPEPFEVAEGDARSRDHVWHALAERDAVHISIDHDREDDCVDAVVEAARARELKRISYISGTTVCEENRWFPLVARKLESERSIVDSGIAYTIFRPGYFMEILPRFAKKRIVLVFDSPKRHWNFVSVLDLARMVTESYRRDDVIGKRLYIHGPQAMTVFDAVKAFRRALHPDKRLVRTPYWLATLIARLTGNERMRGGVKMVRYLETVGQRGSAAEANGLLGAPRITLDRWLEMQRYTGGPPERENR